MQEVYHQKTPFPSREGSWVIYRKLYIWITLLIVELIHVRKVWNIYFWTIKNLPSPEGCVNDTREKKKEGLHLLSNNVIIKPVVES
jgi:hypothetical protein